jgi:putative phage-type endonuclease
MQVTIAEPPQITIPDCVVETYKTREEWLAARRGGISASEVAAALGVSPFRSQFDLWAEKVGLAEPDDLDSKEYVKWGLRLEEPIARAFAEETGRTVTMWPPFTLARHPKHPWLTATPDATQIIVEGSDLGALQIKTTNAFAAREWIEGAPLYYQVQQQSELAVVGYSWGTLCVLIGGNRMLAMPDQLRNDDFIESALPRLAEFMEMVESRTSPPVDASLATAKVLAKLHPEDSGNVIVLPVESAEWHKELTKAKTQIKDCEAIKTKYENLLKDSIGDASYGLLSDGSRYGWLTQTRKEHVVAQATFRVLRKCK